MRKPGSRRTPRSAHPAGFWPAHILLLGPLLCITGGRWGSYLGVASASFFLTDAFVALGSIGLLVTIAANRQRMRPVVWLPGVIVAAVCLIGLVGAAGNPASLIVRDLAPFLYLLILPIVVWAAQILSAHRVDLLIGTALMVHLAWFVPAVFGLLPPVAVGGIAGVPLFTTRGDFDVLITGLGMLWLLRQPKLPLFWKAVLVTLSGAAMVAQGSRGGLLAALAALAFYFILIGRGRLKNVRPFAVAASCFVAAFTFLLVPSVQATPEWASGLAKLVPSESAEFASGQNTINDRLSAWSSIVEFTLAEPPRAIVGSGFGSPVITASGAVSFLSGSTDVRQAHNFVVTWIGYVGLAGTALALVALSVLVAVTVARARGDRVAAFGAAIAVSVLVAGLVGVVVESPFGYQTLVLGFSLALCRNAGALKTTVTEPITSVSPTAVLLHPPTGRGRADHPQSHG